MTQVNKINLTGEELNVAKDQTFILIKHEVIRKISELFGQLERTMKEDIEDYLPENTGANSSAGKIFRGENYHSFPYVLLDYPRLFTTQSVFAIRTMFWWGNEFSFTLHLQGQAWETAKETLIKNLESIPAENIYCCVNTTPWKYHFSNENYRPLEEIRRTGELAGLAEKPFIKLSRKLPIDEYQKVISFGNESMKMFLSLLK